MACVCLWGGTPCQNTPQGVEKVHYECRTDIESSDWGWYTIQCFEQYLILEKRYIRIFSLFLLLHYYYHLFFLHNLQDQVEVVREPPPVPPAPEKSPSSPSNLEDNEPLYDSVCSDDDYGDVSENANLKNGGNVNMAHHANQNTTVRRF